MAALRGPSQLLLRSWSTCAVVRRERLISEVGPDGSGSKPGMEPCTHMPEKSRTDAALALTPSAGATVCATACPKAGVAAAAASVTTKRKSRRCKVMLSSLFNGVPKFSHQATPGRCALGRERDRCADPRRPCLPAAGHGSFREMAAVGPHRSSWSKMPEAAVGSVSLQPSPRLEVLGSHQGSRAASGWANTCAASGQRARLCDLGCIER